MSTADTAIAGAALRVVTALSQDNLDHGGTFSVLIPRERIEDLRRALEMLDPEIVARRYGLLAAVEATQ